MLENNLTDAELNEHVLRQSGLDYISMRVDSEQDFIQALKTFHPDIILADYHVPGFDGLNALAILRGWDKNLPFVFVTGVMGEDLAVESLHKGANDYILKDRLSRLGPSVKQCIAESKQIKSLEASHDRFRRLVETSSDWIWEVDSQVRYSYCSPKCFDLLGYRPEEMLGKTPFDFMPHEEAGRVRAVFTDIAKQQHSFNLLENTGLHKDGHCVILESSGTPIFGPRGDVLGYSGINRDISERKKDRTCITG